MSPRRYSVLRGGEVQVLTDSPNCSLLDAMPMFGTAEFLMQQSIVPVVSWLEGDHSIRCIGSASIISCSGYILTAAHVIMDPLESGYGAMYHQGQVKFQHNLNFGVMIPIWKPGYGITLHKAFLFFPFEKMWHWGSWKASPLFHEKDRWDYLTDIAICKISELPSGRAHQPLQMSLFPFVRGEEAYAMGYAESPDMKLDPNDGGIADRNFRFDLSVSVGSIIGTFPQNHLEREVSVPGPCFDFDARIPGKMSGGPIFGARGSVIRGVISRSFSGEAHAYGSMLGPAMDLRLDEPGVANRTLRSLLKSGSEGMAQVHGDGL